MDLQDTTSLSITNTRSLLKLMSIESVMPSNHLILCCPLLLPSIFPNIRVFSNESVLLIRWPNYWSFSLCISPSREYSGFISFRIEWLDLLAVQGNRTEKKFQSISQSQTCNKRRSWSLLGGLLPVWSTTAFWILVKPLHWEVCSANCWDSRKAAMPAPGAGQQKGPILLHDDAWPRHTTHVSKVEWTGLSNFASSPTFTWPVANWLPLLQVSQQLSIGKTLPQPARGQKCFPRVCWILKHGFLCYRNKQTYFSLAKMWL